MNRSLSAFNSTIREYLDALAKTDKCAQYVDDIGVAASNVDVLVANIEAVFQQIQKAGLPLSMSKCAFGHPKIEFLGRSITTKDIAPLEGRIDNFLKKLKLPISVKSLQRYIGFVQFYRQYIPKLAEKLVPLYKLLQKDVKFVLTQVHKDAIFDINENLARAAKLSLRLPLPDKQLVIMCDASEHAAGYVLLIEDYTESNDGKKKTYAPVAFGSQRFTEGQMSLTMFAKKFFSHAFRLLRRIRPHPVGSQETHHCDDRQQSANAFFPIKADPTKTVESLRPSPAIRRCASPRTRSWKPSC